MGMDRILLGRGESEPGFWVSKPGINVISYASNGFYSGTEAGPEGLQDDGSVLPIYGLNENLDWTASNTYTHGFHKYYPFRQKGQLILSLIHI